MFGRLMRTVNHFEGEQLSKRNKTQRGPSPPHKHTHTDTHTGALTVLVAPVPVRTSDHFDALEDAFEDDPREVLPGCQAHSVIRQEQTVVKSARRSLQAANQTSNSTLILDLRCSPSLMTQKNTSFWIILGNYLHKNHCCRLIFPQRILQIQFIKILLKKTDFLIFFKFFFWRGSGGGRGC